MNRILMLALSVVLGMAAVARGQESEELKARFRQRLPEINALKDQGFVGENNKGFIEFVAAQRKSEDVVNAENADRAKLYQAIAASTGTTPDLVGQRRALQIAKEARAGHFIQDDMGKWKKAP